MRLAHPVYAEVLRASLSPFRARAAAARSLADALETTGGRRREDTLTIAALRLQGGGAMVPGRMLNAAVTARERCDFDLAERLAAAAGEAGAGFAAGLLLGQVLWLQGRAHEAERRLATLVGHEGSDQERAELAATRATILYFGLNQTSAALRVADDAAATIADPVCRDAMTAERARLLGRSGMHAEAVLLSEPLLDDTSGATFIGACMAAATSMAMVGRMTDAIDVANRGLAAHVAHVGAPLPFGPYFPRMITFSALLQAGRLHDADLLATDEYDQAIEQESVEAQAVFAKCRAAAALAQGRVETAARFAREAAAVLRQLNWSLFERFALAVLAHCLARGEADAAQSVIGEIDALGVPLGHLYGPEVLRARAWTEVARGDLAGAHAALWEAAAMAEAGGAWTLESAARHDLARLGRSASVGERLGALAELIEGPLAPARAAHAAALAARDEAALEDVSKGFEDCGAILLASEAAADAATMSKRAGEIRRAAGAERRSRRLAERCEGARTPPLATVAARAALSPRELEIARLAAGGTTSRAIADRLCVSVRTVDNILQAAYHKLGVRGRGELSQALEDR